MPSGETILPSNLPVPLLTPSRMKTHASLRWAVTVASSCNNYHLVNVLHFNWRPERTGTRTISDWSLVAAALGAALPCGPQMLDMPPVARNRLLFALLRM